jgi:hypothetical protein
MASDQCGDAVIRDGKKTRDQIKSIQKWFPDHFAQDRTLIVDDTPDKIAPNEWRCLRSIATWTGLIADTEIKSMVDA